jgi:uncharacterized protein
LREKAVLPEPELVTAVRNGDAATAASLLQGGSNVNAQDEHGWTALAWAAGSGNVETTKLLLAHGADVTLTGRDNRTPLKIARAANRNEVIVLLTDAEKRLGVWQDPRETCLYAKAYYVRELRRFEGWFEKPLGATATIRADIPGLLPADTLADDQIVYLHQDFTVTKSMWHGEDVVFDSVSQAWRTFCEATLGFAIPEDVF